MNEITLKKTGTQSLVYFAHSPATCSMKFQEKRIYRACNRNCWKYLNSAVHD